MPYDLFISYSRKDNLTNRVTELKNQIETDYLEFTKEPLNCFFDLEEIKGMDDWQHRLLQGLKDSHLMLVILSPNYLASPYCEWEIVEYLKYEYSRGVAGDGVAQVYFMEIPGIDDEGFRAQAAQWLEKVSRRQRIDLRPWRDEGADSLKQLDVKKRLEELKESLRKRITRMRVISDVPGNLPAPNPRFVGREREMEMLHKATALGQLGVITAVHGVGGLGKTAIAFQYAYAYANFYPGGRWYLGCANETNLASVIKRLDSDLNITLTEDEKKDDTRGAKRILNELFNRAVENTEKANSKSNIKGTDKESIKPAVLLILDNVDHPELILPPCSDIISGKEWLKVLATTRLGLEELGDDETKQTLLAIDELPFEDALSLLENYQLGGRFKNEDEKGKAGEIVKFLGGFTLAVEVAALYLYECKGRVSFAAFLVLLKREGGAIGVDIVGAKTKNEINHNKLVSVTLAPTLNILSSEEMLVLSFASLLPPDSIPVPWLRVMVIKEYPELGKDSLAGLDDPWLSTINHLLSLRLLQIVDLDGQVPRLVSMHRILQHLVKQPDKIQTGSLIIHAWIRSGFLTEKWHIYENKWEIKPLILFVENLIDNNIGGVQRIIASLCLWLPNTDSSETPLRLMRKCRTLSFDDEFCEITERITILTSLALILRQKGEYDEAEDVLQEGVRLYNLSHIKDELMYATILNNLAKILLCKGKGNDALPIARHALSSIELSLGRNNPTAASFMNNLGEILMAIGNFEEAKHLIDTAYNIRINYFGNNNPYVAVSLTSLAKLSYKKQQYFESANYLKEAIPMLKLYYNEKHFRVADALQIQAQILEKTSQYTEAVSILNSLLSIRNEILPPNHPDILWTLNYIDNIICKLTNQNVL
jgi:hypothetical protein